MVRGVVGWVDLAEPDAIATLSALARDPLLKSVRPMLQDMPDPTWILRADVQAALDALPALGVRFDALVKSAQWPALLTMLERNPALDVVIDHAGKPDIAGRGFDSWSRWIRRVAAHPRVHCKLSGLATEAAWDWSVDTLRPYLDHLLECFGASRLIWGSDWPVVELGGGYLRWREATNVLIAQLREDERDAILGGNARRFYALNACY